jgi:formate dehydrogenase subunit delta
MNIDLLIKMANEIGDFFAGATDPESAPRDVATHIRRYWEPRMRAQMLKYFEQRQGAGLTDLAKNAVALLYAASKAAAGAPPAVGPPASGAPPGAAPAGGAAPPSSTPPAKGAGA